jgi:hypothetical protein
VKLIHLKYLFCIAAFTLFIYPSPLSAKEGDEAKKEEQLYFNYIGVTISSGLNQIEYTDWFVDQRDTKNISGTFFSGGLILDIFVDQFVGEFMLQYVYNANDEDTSLQHLSFTTIGKYAYAINSTFALSAGLGLYMETPPSDKEYDGGGGFLATLGVFTTLGPDYKIVFDLLGSYGHFGIGEGSRKTTYGAKIGIVYNIGRL